MGQASTWQEESMTAELTRLLRKMQTTDGMDLVAVITMDGLVIDSAGRAAFDAQQVAAAACNGLLMARALGGELDRGLPVQAIIEFEHGLLLMEPLDEDLGLILLAPREANLGRLRLMARKYSQELLQATSV
jgi:predicted regulator of Ras-like GTPase activity (Roadblock/LC7/MglB family)